MKEQLISIETAKLAKEKGFDEFCKFIYPLKTFLNYEEDCGKEFNKAISYSYTFIDQTVPIISAPTQSLLQKWLRGKQEIIIIAYPVMFTHTNTPVSQEFKDIEYSFQIFIDGKSEFIFKDDIFESFEEALEKGLFEALKLIEI